MSKSYIKVTAPDLDLDEVFYEFSNESAALKALKRLAAFIDKEYGEEKYDGDELDEGAMTIHWNEGDADFTIVNHIPYPEIRPGPTIFADYAV